MSYSNIFVTATAPKFEFEDGLGMNTDTVYADNLEAAITEFQQRHPQTKGREFVDNSTFEVVG
jgi:hypothetical protein